MIFDSYFQETNLVSPPQSRRGMLYTTQQPEDVAKAKIPNLQGVEELSNPPVGHHSMLHTAPKL